jgi:hypothetical protein
MDELAPGLDEFWFRNGLAAAIALAIGAALLPGAPIARTLRLAALLPPILLAGMLAAWVGWELIVPRIEYLRLLVPLVLELPIDTALAAMLAATCLAALAVARCAGRLRLDTWMRAVVVIALVDLLLLGLWLPLASWSWGQRTEVGWTAEVGRELFLGSRPRLLALALVPPLVVATAFAALALRRPDLARRARGIWVGALSLLFVLAVLFRLGDTDAGYLVYLNLVHFLAASAFVAAAALVAFVASLWLRARSVRRRLARARPAVIGVIPAEGDGPRGVVACLELEGWLAGPRARVDSFEVITAAGPVPIPVGAELAASVPLASTCLQVGEAVAVIRRGDRVVIGGLIEPAPDHPFRSSSALVPGPSGVVVRREDDGGGGGFSAIALVAWRPCVAFLVILTAVAVPGLAAALALL